MKWFVRTVSEDKYFGIEEEPKEIKIDGKKFLKFTCISLTGKIREVTLSYDSVSAIVKYQADDNLSIL